MVLLPASLNIPLKITITTFNPSRSITARLQLLPRSCTPHKSLPLALPSSRAINPPPHPGAVYNLSPRPPGNTTPAPAVQGQRNTSLATLSTAPNQSQFHATDPRTSGLRVNPRGRGVAACVAWGEHASPARGKRAGSSEGTLFRVSLRAAFARDASRPSSTGKPRSVLDPRSPPRGTSADRDRRVFDGNRARVCLLGEESSDFLKIV